MNIIQEANNDQSVTIMGITRNEDDFSENDQNQSGSQDIFAKANELYVTLDLSKTTFPGLGDCLIQLCILSLYNRHDALTKEEEERLSMVK